MVRGIWNQITTVVSKRSALQDARNGTAEITKHGKHHSRRTTQHGKPEQRYSSWNAKNVEHRGHVQQSAALHPQPFQGHAYFAVLY